MYIASVRGSISPRPLVRNSLRGGQPNRLNKVAEPLTLVFFGNQTETAPNSAELLKRALSPLKRTRPKDRMSVTWLLRSHDGIPASPRHSPGQRRNLNRTLPGEFGAELAHPLTQEKPRRIAGLLLM